MFLNDIGIVFVLFLENVRQSWNIQILRIVQIIIFIYLFTWKVLGFGQLILLLDSFFFEWKSFKLHET